MTSAETASARRPLGRGLVGAVRAHLPAVSSTALVAASQLGLGMLAGRPDDPAYYRGLRQAPFAPPAWVFGPAWVLAKKGQSIAVVRTLRAPRSAHRRKVLAALALDSAVYVTFSYVYFRRRSPVLAAVWTAADAATTAVAVGLLARSDKVAALAMAPQTAWLALATPVAVWQAAVNPDPFLGTPALLGPAA